MPNEGYLILPGPCRPDDPDAELVARVASGHEAWAGIETKYRGPLLRDADKRLGERVDSEEAVQATFVSAFSHILQFRAEPKTGVTKPTFLTWLWRIHLNELARRSKKLVEAGKQEKSLSELTEGDEQKILVEPPSPDQRHDQRRELVRVVSDIARLPEQQSKVCNLILLAGLSESETAEVLSMKIDAVRMNLMRGKSTLKELCLKRQADA